MTAVAPTDILIVDLNNFSCYPTIPVGLLVAALRREHWSVSVFSPLTVGVRGFARAGRTGRFGHVDAMLRFYTGVAGSEGLRTLRARAAALVRPDSARSNRLITASLQKIFETALPRVVLISAYTMYLEVAAEIARVCRAIGIPVVVGGSYFNEPAIARTWLDTPGISVVVAAEAERIIPTIVAALATGQNVPDLPGIWTPATGVRQVAPPLQDLDSLPFADYSDFPWHLYPRRIIPMMAGRGCGWGVCTFCSDVSTVAGRTYRSRSPANVLDEVEYQGRKHDADLFVMLDLKLNSDLEVWRALLDRMQRRRPGARWTASVHVGRGENGLSLDELRAARAAGLVRVTTGLESGSQHVLNSMAKGTDLERTSRFLKDAHKAGLSVRTTMIIGYPGETAADIRKTAEFLALHEPYLERVMVNRFSIQPGTAAAQRIEHSPRKFGALTVGKLDTRNALLPHRNSATKESGYFRSVWRVLSAANQINRKPLRADAQLLEGVM